MNIYKMKNKDIEKELNNFIKTEYGKITFLLAYSIPLITILFVISSFATILYSKYFLYYFKTTLPIYFGLFLLFLISFILGTMYYYNKLETYIEKKK